MVAESKNVRFCTFFASSIEGTDVARMEDIVFEKGNSGELALFATNVEGANAKRIIDELANQNQYKMICRITRELNEDVENTFKM